MLSSQYESAGAHLLVPSRRIHKFRSDYIELKTQFESAKKQAEQVVGVLPLCSLITVLTASQKVSQQRSELLGPPGTRQRFGPNPAIPAESPFRGSTPDPLYASREQHALREHSFIQNSETQLDAFIAQGQEVLNNLVDQRQMLKGTQKRLLDAANTLGLSRNVIGWIERRRYAGRLADLLQLTVMQHTGHLHISGWRSDNFHRNVLHLELVRLISCI